jgi:hypothetical protein
VAAAALVCVAIEYAWVWIFGGAVFYSAMCDVRNVIGERARMRTLTIHGRLVTIDGVVARIERGWLGPGLTVVWLRIGKRREMVSVFRCELRAVDHAALRRLLREFDFR